MSLTQSQYSRRNRAISNRLVRAIIRLLTPFLGQSLTERQYATVAQAAFRLVHQARRESAELAREYFDSEWARNVPELDVPEVNLPTYRFADFEAAMLPVKHALQSANTADVDLALAGKIAMKETENGGRRTMIRAVQANTEPKGWARYDPEPPTCGFCLMLISRGPAYESASAGRFKTRNAKTYRGNSQDKFHNGCTCEVVAVFNDNAFPGRDQYLEMHGLWEDHIKDNFSGTAALNAFRRLLKEKSDNREIKTVGIAA